MKKIIFSTVFFLFMAGLASAQSDSRDTNTKTVSNTSDAKRSSRHRSRPVSTSENASTVNTASATETTSARSNGSVRVIPDNRTEYMQDGQLATYTGHQASPSNSDEYQSKKGRKKNTDRTRD